MKLASTLGREPERMLKGKLGVVPKIVPDEDSADAEAGRALAEPPVLLRVRHEYWTGCRSAHGLGRRSEQRGGERPAARSHYDEVRATLRRLSGDRLADARTG